MVSDAACSARRTSRTAPPPWSSTSAGSLGARGARDRSRPRIVHPDDAQHVGGALADAGAVVQQPVGRLAELPPGLSGDAEHVAPEVGGVPRGDPPPAPLRPFHQDHGAPERGHDPVARRETPGARRHAPGELAEHEPAADDARVEAGVAARVDDVGAAAEHGDGRERRAGVRVEGRLPDGRVGLDGSLLRDGVDPEGKPADDARRRRG